METLTYETLVEGLKIRLPLCLFRFEWDTVDQLTWTKQNVLSFCLVLDDSSTRISPRKFILIFNCKHFRLLILTSFSFTVCIWVLFLKVCGVLVKENEHVEHTHRLFDKYEFKPNLYAYLFWFVRHGEAYEFCFVLCIKQHTKKFRLHALNVTITTSSGK